MRFHLVWPASVPRRRWLLFGEEISFAGWLLVEEQLAGKTNALVRQPLPLAETLDAVAGLLKCPAAGDDGDVEMEDFDASSTGPSTSGECGGEGGEGEGGDSGSVAAATGEDGNGGGEGGGGGDGGSSGGAGGGGDGGGVADCGDAGLTGWARIHAENVESDAVEAAQLEAAQADEDVAAAENALQAEMQKLVDLAAAVNAKMVAMQAAKAVAASKRAAAQRAKPDGDVGPTCSPTDAHDADTAASSAQPYTPTPREVCTALGQPAQNPNGAKLAPSLLDRRYQGLQSGSGARGMVQAAKAVQAAATRALLPDVEAHAQLASLLGASRSKHDQQREVAKSPMAAALIDSLRAATARSERMAYKAQILSPFTTMYSRRTFNEFFQEQLGTRLTPYAWEFAQWHAHVWGVAQPALQMEPTKKWRLKGGSDLGTLPNLMIICAVEHIVSHLMHTAHGVHRIRQDDGTFLEFPATVRDRLPAELWKDHKKNCPPSHLLGRTHYLELVQLCSNQDQKSLGALDGVAEFCGRVQEARLTEGCDELASLLGALLAYALQGTADRASVASAQSHAVALKRKVAAVITFIKRGLKEHVPSCDTAEAPVACADHCARAVPLAAATPRVARRAR